MNKRDNKYHRNSQFLLLFLIWLAILDTAVVAADEVPNVPQEYSRYFVHYVDQRSFAEKLLNIVGLSGKEMGRSIALIAGVSKYPHMSAAHRQLEPASKDINKISDHLIKKQYFDEVIVLRDDAVNFVNFSFFLQTYLPERLEKFPNSRFLFAFCGHGMNEGHRGYFLKNNAQSLKDKHHGIRLAVIRILLEEVIEKGHHVLAMINTCYSGAFAKRPYGGDTFYPKLKGAHAITAGGSNEPVWHDPVIGPGSIFFEKLLKGLEGRADLYPKRPGGTSGDGITTVHELIAFITQEVQVFTDQHQNPVPTDLLPGGSLGGFFFLNEMHKTVAEEIARLNRSSGQSMGSNGQEHQDSSSKADIEELLWQEVKSMDIAASYEAYLERYPKGKYAHIARLKLKVLSRIEFEPVEAEFVLIRNARVREQPDINSKHLMTLNGGTKIYVPGKVKNKNWYIVEKEAKKLGYVFGKLLQRAQPQVAQVQPDENKKTIANLVRCRLADRETNENIFVTVTKEECTVLNGVIVY